MLENIWTVDDFRGSPLVLDFWQSFGQRKSRRVRREMKCVGLGIRREQEPEGEDES